MKECALSSLEHIKKKPSKAYSSTYNLTKSNVSSEFLYDGRKGDNDNCGKDDNGNDESKEKTAAKTLKNEAVMSLLE